MHVQWVSKIKSHSLNDLSMRPDDDIPADIEFYSQTVQFNMKSYL